MWDSNRTSSTGIRGGLTAHLKLKATANRFYLLRGLDTKSPPPVGAHGGQIGNLKLKANSAKLIASIYGGEGGIRIKHPPRVPTADKLAV
jgi:hypothetical protein